MIFTTPERDSLDHIIPLLIQEGNTESKNPEQHNRFMWGLDRGIKAVTRGDKRMFRKIHFKIALSSMYGKFGVK